MLCLEGDRQQLVFILPYYSKKPQTGTFFFLFFFCVDTLHFFQVSWWEFWGLPASAKHFCACCSPPQMLLVLGNGGFGNLYLRSFSSWELEGSSLPWPASDSSCLAVSNPCVAGLKLLE